MRAIGIGPWSNTDRHPHSLASNLPVATENGIIPNAAENLSRPAVMLGGAALALAAAL
jgi:hypothetical protein